MIRNVCMNGCESPLRWRSYTDGTSVSAELRCVEEDHVLVVISDEAVDAALNGDENFRIGPVEGDR
jgi:hypothetical protein